MEVSNEGRVSIDQDFTKSDLSLNVTSLEPQPETSAMNAHPEDVVMEEGAANDSVETSTSLKSLSDKHAALQSNLRRALFDLREKQGFKKDLEEDIVRQREKTWLLEERIRLMKEKLVCYKYCMERKEKKQESLMVELAGAKCKLEEAKKSLEKIKSDYKIMKQKKKKRIEEMGGAYGQDESKRVMKEQLEEEIKQLKRFKCLVDKRDPQIRSLMNGSKIMELEQRKRGMNDAILERSTRVESLYFELDEKSERIDYLKESLENAKKQHEEMMKERKNHYGYLIETELRLQRSLEYLQSKIDYGVYKPAPWPDVRANMRFQM